MPHKRSKFSARMASRAASSDAAPSGAADEAHMRSLPKGAMRVLDAARVQAAFRARKEAGERISAEDVGPKEKERLKALAKAKEKGKAKATEEELKIRPGERLGDFNRRVEQAMAPELAATVKAGRTKRKREQAAAALSGSSKAAKVSVSDEDGPHVCKDPSRCTVHHETWTARDPPSGKGKGKPAEPGKAELRRKREAMQGAAEGEWAAPRVRKLNDVALAPPTLTRAPRGESDAALKRKAALAEALGREKPAANKVRLPEPLVRGGEGGLRREEELRKERERAVREYRKMKFGRETRGA